MPRQRGEILMRGPNVMAEYWATPRPPPPRWSTAGSTPATSAARDADGYFYRHDRKKNMIISGGENIYPAEIERVLLAHPGVAEAAVIGAPDPRWQEVPVAIIVRRDGCDISAEALRAFLAPQLARFKLPRRFVFVDELPRNALGKVQHFRLKQAEAAAGGG